jgi:hypothetical protein
MDGFVARGQTEFGFEVVEMIVGSYNLSANVD